MPFSDARRRERGATMLLLTTMLTMMLIPLVGLAIDGTMCYIVQARLSAAADGAALGAGRLLGTTANTQQIAGEFLRANFPHQYWGANNLQTNIVATNNFSSHTITVNATVDVPLLFMRIFGYNYATAAAGAIATRRDTRVELVLDRSNSMSPNIGALRVAAASFVNKFTAGVDELGVVMYGGSAFVAYPPTKSLSATGPNTNFKNTPGAGQENALTMINSMASGSNTGTAEGLYLAWQELKAAHALDNDPTRLNAIVLFTDGVPNGFSAYFNDPAGTSIKASSNCTYKTSTGPSRDMRAWMGATCQLGSPGCNGIQFFNPTKSKGVGIFVPITRDTSHTAKWWTSNTNDLVNLSGTPVNGCTHLDDTDLGDLSRIPPKDLYGISTNGTDYTESLLYNTFNVHYDNTKPSNGYHVALASWNAVDNVAKAILADNTLRIAIYCIVYTGNGGVDAALLKRVANTLDSGAHNNNWETGMYVSADDNVALQNAFNTVASEILRLAK